MTYTAFMFCRGGSKGVQNKNLRQVGSLSLLAQSILVARKCPLISRLIVSTDSDIIAEEALKYGAQVLIRPSELAQDDSPELLSWQHAVSEYCSTLRGCFISLPVTSPLRDAEDIQNAVEKFERKKFDIIFGITKTNHSPELNMVQINKKDEIELIDKNNQSFRRQDSRMVYNVTTVIYVGSVNYIKACTNLMQGKVGYIEVPQERSLDIDTEHDLLVADLLIKHRENQNVY